MATYNKFQDFSEQLARGVHDWDAHTFKVALTNTAPLATQTTWNTTDHPAPAAANGYTAGGTATTISISESSGTTTVSGTQVVFTASGAIWPRFTIGSRKARAARMARACSANSWPSSGS